MIRGIRFALKRTLLTYQVVPKSPTELRCHIPTKVPRKFRKGQNTICTHRCSFLPFEWNMSDLLNKLSGGTKMVPDFAVKPPDCVKGMTELDKSKFDTIVQAPSIVVPINKLNVIMKHLKQFKFIKSHLKHVVELTECDPLFSTHRRFLMDPERVMSFETIAAKLLLLDDVAISEKDFELIEVKLSYENWNFTEIMQAIMPDNQDAVAGFAQVGHIVHFNLRSQSLPFKNIIGEVILDKFGTCVKTVVNKLDTIDNTYRTFQMELLAGENNFVTQTKENGVTFELDFSKVYWNTRLGTEHHRMVENLTSKDIVFDVFAGIGPFSVPAVKQKKAQVFANDLNPSSYEYLVKNVQLNKCDSFRIKCYNKDGRDFIKTVVKDELTKLYTVETEDGNMTSENGDSVKTHVNGINSISMFMNLPALAYTFLDAFKGLLHDLKELDSAIPLPTVHCYCFTNVPEADEKFNGDVDKELRHRTINIIGCLTEEDISVRLVRDVAPKKEMKCISFNLTEKILCHPVDDEQVKPNLCDENDEPPTKSRRIEGNL